MSKQTKFSWFGMMVPGTYIIAVFYLIPGITDLVCFWIGVVFFGAALAMLIATTLIEQNEERAGRE